MNSEKDLYNGFFSHIYVEKEAYKYEMTTEILDKLKYATVIDIDHYKDVFSGMRKNYMKQLKSRGLILAVRHGEMVYEGAPVCQSFGQKNFYYASSAMNCPFNCEYCYLKGMYPSGNIVVFVNFEDYERELRELKKQGDLYVCASYDTDIIGLEKITGQLTKWVEFAKNNPDILIEMRTKSAPADVEAVDNLIYAYTLSPDMISKKYEPGSPPLRARVKSVSNAIDKGARVRLCFDPMIYVKDYENVYGEFINELKDNIDLTRVTDFSIGTFRISEEYLKRMRKVMPDSEIAWFPYEIKDGYAQYPEEIDKGMQSFMKNELMKITREEKIWTWN